MVNPVFSMRFFTIAFLLASVSLQAQDVQVLPFSEGREMLNSEYSPQTDNELALPFSFDVAAEKKSVGRALLFSLLLPGAGEYYVGEKGHAGFFLGMEVLAWSALLLNDYHFNNLRDNYRTFAAQHADVSRAGKDKQYWINIGKFDDIYAYNEQRLRDRNVDALYTNTEAFYWEWDSRQNRLKYDAKRLDAVNVESREVYIITGILVNHLVSGINAMRLARKHNKALASRTEYRFFVDDYYNAPVWGLRLSHRF